MARSVRDPADRWRVNRPLTGIRVLDFGWVIAGPTATRILRDFGADVIKVEPPGRGDFLRNGDMVGANLSFGYWNYGKRSISVNLKDPRGVTICRDLAAKSDVVIQNFRPGTLERLGLGPADLQAINPRLVYCSIAGFGPDTSLGQRPLQAGIAHAMSGIMAMVGEPDDPPLQPPCSVADPNAGMHAALAILAGLMQRELTGHAPMIDLSVFDALVWLMGPMAEQVSLGAKIGWERRMGHLNRGTIPVGSFEARDGWLMFAGGIDDIAWQRIAGAIGRSDLADRKHAWRHEHQDEVYGIMADWVMAQESVAAAEQHLLAHDVLCSRINTPEEMVRLPYVRERGVIQEVEHRQHGAMLATNPPYHFDGQMPAWNGPAPGLGEHNAEVLEELLGIPRDQVRALEREGVLFRAEALGSAKG